MPVMSEASFAEILGSYVSQRDYTIGQLRDCLPPQTDYRQLAGGHGDKAARLAHTLVKVAAALHLDEVEATRLLHAAGHGRGSIVSANR
jgi:HPt (histidine-containing phosphotransfer) domain-containing protein